MVGIGHSEPGKTTPHLISSADILYIVVSYRVNHGRKWVSKLSQILSKETLQFVSLESGKEAPRFQAGDELPATAEKTAHLP